MRFFGDFARSELWELVEFRGSTHGLSFLWIPGPPGLCLSAPSKRRAINCGHDARICSQVQEVESTSQGSELFGVSLGFQTAVCGRNEGWSEQYMLQVLNTLFLVFRKRRASH